MTSQRTRSTLRSQNAMIKEDMAALNEALASVDKPRTLALLGDIARRRGMTDVAKSTQVSRPQLYRALSENGNPSFYTIVKVLETLGFVFQVKRQRSAPAAEPEAPAEKPAPAPAKKAAKAAPAKTVRAKPAAARAPAKKPAARTTKAKKPAKA